MIFFSADHHFYHANIIKHCRRSFGSVEEMNEEMIRRWNFIVKPEDTIFYLGDFSMAKRPVELFARRLHGEKHLIMGNHDPCHPIHKKKALSKQVYIDFGFKSVEIEGVLEMAGKNVLLHHMPYRASAEASEQNSSGYRSPKHLAFRPEDKGMWLLHGHVHTKWKTNGRMINIGVDAWDFYPVSMDEVEKIILAHG